jgi:hypothetical protein
MLYRDVETSRLLAGERASGLAGDRRSGSRRKAVGEGADVARRLRLPPDIVRRLRAGGFLERLALSDDQIRRRVFGGMWRDAGDLPDRS